MPTVGVCPNDWGGIRMMAVIYNAWFVVWLWLAILAVKRVWLFCLCLLVALLPLMYTLVMHG